MCSKHAFAAPSSAAPRAPRDAPSAAFPPLPRLFFYAARLFSELRFACHEAPSDASAETGSLSPGRHVLVEDIKGDWVFHTPPQRRAASAATAAAFSPPRSPLSAPPVQRGMVREAVWDADGAIALAGPSVRGFYVRGQASHSECP